MKPVKLPPSHPRYDRSQPLLRGIVYVHVDANNGVSFDTNLTRVPCIDEAIEHEGEYYRVLRVFHARVDDDGRAFAGWHAIIDAAHWPEEMVPSIKRQPPKRGTKLPF